MLSLKPAAILTAIGTGLGATIGGVLGGPASIAAGAKVGAALGIKVAGANKAEQAADAIGSKISEKVDSLGAKISDGVDNAGKKLDVFIAKAQQQIFSTAERIADTWATIMLCGYAWQLATASATANMMAQKTVCTSAFESLSCLSMEVTSMSINGVAIIAAVALAFKIKDIVFGVSKKPVFIRINKKQFSEFLKAHQQQVKQLTNVEMKV